MPTHDDDSTIGRREGDSTAVDADRCDTADEAVDADRCDTADEMLAWAESYAADVVQYTTLDVDLEHVEWEVSHRAKRRAGATISARLPDATVGEPIDWSTRTADPTCTVRLTWRAYEELGHAQMAATVRHELVHVEQVQTYGATDHGPEFERRAATLDAPVHCESFTPAPYLLSCEACEEVVARRYRRSKLVKQRDEYRSRCCGASLSLEHDPGG